jgi:1-acyl-sn-glycerol-3-phosphate acyltransferase
MLRALWYLVNLTFWTITMATVVVLLAVVRWPYRPWGLYDRCQRLWGRMLVRAGRTPVTVEGGAHLDLSRPHIICANHASFFDILALSAAFPVPVKFVAKKELFPIPFFGWALRAMRAVRLDRQNLKQAFTAYEEAAAIIRRDRLHVMVFPEGTRTRTGELLPFKKGPFVLAVSCQADVVPVYVGGTFGILPKGSVRVRPHPIVIAIGEPISSVGLTYDDREALSARVEAAIRAMRARVEAQLAAR